MGAPMALHLIKAGHQLFVYTRGKLHAERRRERGHAVHQRQGRGRARRHRLHDGARHARCRGGAVRRRTAWPRACRKGKTVVDMSSISPIETKAFAKKINALGCDYLDAPVSGGEVGAKAASADHHGRRARGRLRARQAAVRADGQEHHAGRRQRRRPDHQGGQPDHRRAEHRRGRRGAGLRQQGRRRPGQGAPGADGRLCRPAASWKCMASA